MPALVSSAITVGALPVGLGQPGRPSLEQSWRSAMIQSNISPATNRSRWIKSASYLRLDPSEKSAVSYFLGMIQAQSVCNSLGLSTHLVHLDAVRKAWNVQVPTGLRPDLVGFNLRTGAKKPDGIVVEAKGRSGPHDFVAIAHAKQQVKSVTAIQGVSNLTRIASLAYFNGVEWESWLEDPEGDEDIDARSFSVGEILFAYYLPLAQILDVESKEHRNRYGVEFVERGIDSMDYEIGMQRDIFELAVALESEKDLSTRKELADRDLVRLVRELTPLFSTREISDESGDLEYEPEKDVLGVDGIFVSLGQEWTETAVNQESDALTT